MTDCSYYKDDPACGTNGETYRNICELYNAICISGGKFKMKGRGSCVCVKPDHHLCKQFEGYQTYYCKHPWLVENCKYSCGTCAPKPGCHAKADIGFIFDPSESYSKYLLKTLAATFGVSKRGARAGVITLSNDSKFSIKLNDYKDIIKFNAAVDTITPVGIGTIDRALQLARNELFSLKNGGRHGVPKLLVLASHHLQTKNPIYTQMMADKLRQTGTTIVIVGTGPGTYTTELTRLAGSPGNVFIASTYKELVGPKFIDDLISESCKKVLDQVELNGDVNIHPA